MTETEALLLETMRDLKGEIREFGREMRQEIGEIKETQGRMDERLKSLEKNKDEDECMKKRIQALESSSHMVKSDGRKGKTTAITISLAGLGAVVTALWPVIKSLFGVGP